MLHKFIKRASLAALVSATWIFTPLQAAAAEPRLVILVIVDGLGYDALDQYRPNASGGLATLVREGFEFRSAYHDHGVTTSAPGHATLATGAPPSVHGIVDNGWTEGFGQEARQVNDPLDPAYPILNHASFLTDVIAGVSPARRRADTIGDWLTSAHGESRAIAIGQGTTSSMAMAPSRGGAAYWTSPVGGGFMSSRYFLDAYPQWVLDFNVVYRRRAQDTATWQFSAWDAQPVPADEMAGGRDTAFPHAFVPDAAADAATRCLAHLVWFRETPMHDEMLIAFAEQAIREEGLGTDPVTDSLVLNLSSIDEASHSYGPASREAWDALYRLDRALGGFITFLDATVGRENYILALSADHGVASTAEDVAGGERVSPAEIAATIQQIDAIFAAHPEAVAQRLARALLLQKSYVADVYAADALTLAHPGFYERLYANSIAPGRVPNLPLMSFDLNRSVAERGLIVRLRMGANPDFATAVHVSPYDTERHVPLFFIGGGVRPGAAAIPVRSMDVAPTLAAAAGVSPSETARGVSLLDLIR